MTVFWSEKVDAILSVGLSLEDIGVRNWALDRAQALEALHRLEVAHIAILGGDVYELRNGSLQPTYDNWYCDRVVHESERDFVTRSILVARSYLSNFACDSQELRFAIVPQPDAAPQKGPPC